MDVPAVFTAGSLACCARWYRNAAIDDRNAKAHHAAVDGRNDHLCTFFFTLPSPPAVGSLSAGVRRRPITRRTFCFSPYVRTCTCTWRRLFITCLSVFFLCAGSSFSVVVVCPLPPFRRICAVSCFKTAVSTDHKPGVYTEKCRVLRCGGQVCHVSCCNTIVPDSSPSIVSRSRCL